MKKNIFCIIFFLFLLPKLTRAIPVTDARNLSMGGLAICDVDPGSAVFLNPARLNQADGLRTSYTQTRLSIDGFDFAASGGFTLFPGILSLGLGWDAQAVRNQAQYVTLRDSNGQVIVDPVSGQPATQLQGFFTENDNVFFLSAGTKAGSLEVGASLKYYLSDFGNAEGTGWGLDLSAEAELTHGIKVAATLYDLGGSTISFQDAAQNQSVPGLFTTSLAFVPHDSGSFSIDLEPGIVCNAVDGSDLHGALGLEGSWNKNVMVRVGENRDGFSAGVGLVAHPEKVFKEIKVDYTYLSQASDGYPSRLTLTVGW